MCKKFMTAPTMQNKEFSTHHKSPPVYKIIIVGESNVGKSSLFLRYTKDQFKEAIANTIGINNTFKELIVDNEPVHLQIWDTAGQERFKSIVAAFYREADGFIFVYDVTSKRSFDYMKQSVSDLQGDWDPRFTLLVGNKADYLEDDERVEESKVLGEYALETGFSHCLASAKTGENVNEMFEELSRKLFRMKDNTALNVKTVDISKKRKKRKFWCW